MSARILHRARLAILATSAPRALMLIAWLACTACTWGVKASDIPWSRGPDGAPATVRIEGDRQPMTGELVAVDSLGILLRTTILSRIRWGAVRALDVRGLGSGYRVAGGAIPSIATIQRLALVSHFPQGVEPAVLTQLLAATNQSAVEEIR